MFPKAHAAAYVMMAWRIAYCKVFTRLPIMRHIFPFVRRVSTMRSCVREKSVWNIFIKITREEKILFQKEQDVYRDMNCAGDVCERL